MTITICDTRNGRITPVDYAPRPVNGFIWWNMEQREVRDIHVTRNGTQFELY